MSAATLRAARPTDAGRLGSMMTQAARAHAWKPRLHSGAEDIAHAGLMIERGWVTVIERGGAPLAFLAREGSYIHALFVSPEAQGAGLGRRLLRHAKTQAARLDLWTFAENHGARRFYRREGFTPTERPPASDEGLPEVHLTWQRDPRVFSVRNYPGGAPQERGAAPPSPLTDKDPT